MSSGGGGKGESAGEINKKTGRLEGEEGRGKGWEKSNPFHLRSSALNQEEKPSFLITQGRLTRWMGKEELFY